MFAYSWDTKVTFFVESPISCWPAVAVDGGCSTVVAKWTAGGTAEAEVDGWSGDVAVTAVDGWSDGPIDETDAGDPDDSASSTATIAVLKHTNCAFTVSQSTTA